MTDRDDVAATSLLQSQKIRHPTHGMTQKEALAAHRSSTASWESN